MTSWQRTLLQGVGGDGAAEVNENAQLARQYDTYFTGRWFDLLADQSHPYEVTARDLIAVSMLGVHVPPRAAVWILGEGAIEVSRLLSQIPRDTAIWQVEPEVLSDDSPAAALWRLLQRGSWPSSATNKVGPVVAGKILAAKRPDLIPVYDRRIRSRLGLPEEATFWLSMREQLYDGEARQRVLSATKAARSVGGSPRARTPLRGIDLILWMRDREEDDSSGAED